MPRQFALVLALATLSATALTVSAQSADTAASTTTPVPIERTSLTPYGYNTYATTFTAGQVLSTTHGTASAQPAPGIILRIGRDSSVRAVALTPENVELRVEGGPGHTSGHHPPPGAPLLVDLPGGQTALLKDGLYTVNAATNTIRVLKGEAIAFPPNQKQVKIKEQHAVALTGANVHSIEFDPPQARADLIPYAPAPGGDGSRGPAYTYAPYGYGDPYAYGDGFYDAYPYTYGYPGFYPFGSGLGLGFYGGGFHGGGFRGHR
jgi:hypothetical protein